MKKILYIASMLAIIFILTGCITPSYNSEAPADNDGTSTEFAGIQIKAIPFNTESLEQRYGSMAPCFIRYPGMIPPKNIYVVQIEVLSNQHKLSIQPTSARLIGEKSGSHALSVPEIKDRIGAYLSETEMEQFGRLIDLDYTDDKIFINPQITETYMLFFISTMQRNEEAILEIPAQSGGDTGVVRLPLQWSDSSQSDLHNTGDRNSGIFLEQQEKGE